MRTTRCISEGVPRQLAPRGAARDAQLQAVAFQGLTDCRHRQVDRAAAERRRAGIAARDIARGTSASRPIDGPRAPSVTPQHAVLTHRGTFDSWECDESGCTTPRFQIARFAESATQLIEHLGLSKAALRSRNLGSAALDYAIEYRAPLRPGQTVDIRSGVLEVRGKVLRCFHQLIDSGRGEVATIIEVAIVFFDLTTRKSVAMPPEIIAGARDVMAAMTTQA